MEKKLKAWQGWLLFGGAMVVVFVLGLVVSSLMERRAEIVSVFNNKRVEIKGIEARNEVFGENYPGNTTHGNRLRRLILKANLMVVKQ